MLHYGKNQNKHNPNRCHRPINYPAYLSQEIVRCSFFCSLLGNALANNIWENKLKGQKPDPTSTQEDKERFIMAKYNNKEFLAPLPPGLGTSASLVDAICR